MSRRRPNATGRASARDQFVPLSYSMLRSEAWRSLSGAAAKVYPELRSRYNGGNNGQLSLSLEEGAKKLHLGKATVHRALKELEQKGFIRLTKRGRWYGREASTYAATDRMVGRVSATNDWKKWRPPTGTKTISRFQSGPINTLASPLQTQEPG